MTVENFPQPDAGKTRMLHAAASIMTDVVQGETDALQKLALFLQIGTEISAAMSLEELSKVAPFEPCGPDECSCHDMMNAHLNAMRALVTLRESATKRKRESMLEAFLKSCVSDAPSGPPL
jgi:hypothetical protein